jgi:radical SAM superfamily enzyme YgiQ (UPF0313 family)
MHNQTGNGNQTGRGGNASRFNVHMEDEMQICYIPYEQGPIRPPSEAYSLLIRVTRNCPWNKCEFCGVYSGQKFELRSVQEIKEDILRAAAFHGQRGTMIKTAFLQDANSMIMRTTELVEVLKFLKETFPGIERITSYGRSHTLARRSVGELKELKEAGLSRIHVGLETGFGELLDFVKKGCTPEQHVAAGRKVKEAGITLSEYVMPGLGGKRWWRQHAVETARVLNQIDPDFIRIRTMSARPDTPIYQRFEKGEWEPLNDEGIIVEERLFIQSLEGINSYFASDHMLNLLMELNGKFPEDKEKLLEIIERYLELPEEEKTHFNVGRRLGYYACLDDLEREDARAQVDKAIERLKRNFEGSVEEAITKWMQQMI